jgi:hypothetical protein
VWVDQRQPVGVAELGVPGSCPECGRQIASLASHVTALCAAHSLHRPHCNGFSLDLCHTISRRRTGNSFGFESVARVTAPFIPHRMTNMHNEGWSVAVNGPSLDARLNPLLVLTTRNDRAGALLRAGSANPRLRKQSAFSRCCSCRCTSSRHQSRIRPGGRILATKRKSYRTGA